MEEFSSYFLPYKTCKLGAAGHRLRGLARMKIMKIILCYCAQWCCSSCFQKLKAPSSFEVFRFWMDLRRRLKLSQNNVLMSISFCDTFSYFGSKSENFKTRWHFQFLKTRRATSLGAITKYNLHNFHSG